MTTTTGMNQREILQTLFRARVLATDGIETLRKTGMPADEYTLFLYNELFYRDRMSAQELYDALVSYTAVEEHIRAQFIMEYMAAVRPSHFALLNQKFHNTNITFISEFISYGINAYLASTKNFGHDMELEAFSDIENDEFYIENMVLHNDFTVDLSIYIPREKYHYHVGVQTDVPKLLEMFRNCEFAADELYVADKLDRCIRRSETTTCFINFKEETGRLPHIKNHLLKFRIQNNFNSEAA